jgi:hypothetical protein
MRRFRRVVQKPITAHVIGQRAVIVIDYHCSRLSMIITARSNSGLNKYIFDNIFSLSVGTLQV